MNRRVQLLVLALAAAFLVSPAVPASADPPPSVTLTTDRSVYVAADTINFTSKTVAANLDFVLSVQFPGTTVWKALCASYNVGNDTFTCQLGAAYNVQARAQLIDDKGTKDTSDDTVEATTTVSVPVRAQMGIQSFGYHATSGAYALYGKGSSPMFRSATYPAWVGKRCLRHVIQRHYKSGWKNVTTSPCKVEGKQGRVDWTWSGKHASKVNFRVRATFAGDVLNQPNTSKWLYFRFK